MTQSLEEIQTLLNDGYGFAASDVRFLNQGCVNNCFTFVLNGTKQVLRIKQPGESVDESNLDNEITVYEFLQSKHYKHIPELVASDTASNSFVISYIDGAEADLRSLSVSNLETIAEQISTYHNYPFADYVDFCQEHDRSYTQPTTPLEDFEWYQIRRYENIKNTVTAEWREWLSTHLPEYRKLVLQHPTGEARLIHGDIMGNVLKDAADNFYFIDWEQGRYSYYEDIGCILGRATKLSDIDPEVLDIYCTYTQRTVEEVNFFLQSFVYHHYLGGTLWALERYVGSPAGSAVAQEFLAIAIKRKHCFEAAIK